MLIERISEWKLSPQDDREIARLLARCFATDFGGRSFYQTRQHLRLVHRKGPIVAHMALQFRAMRLGERLITVAGIGDVATDPEHRGQGMARTLLQEAIALVGQSPAEFIALFGTAALYGAAGFRKVTNTMLWTEMTGAMTLDVRREPAESLMVLPLRGKDWDETVQLDLLGNLF